MIPSAPPLVLRGHQGAVYDLAWHESTGCWISAGGDGVLAAWKHGEEHGKAVPTRLPFYALTVSGMGMVVGGNSTGELVMHTPEGPRIMGHVHKAPFCLVCRPRRGLVEGDGQGNMWSMGVAARRCCRDAPMAHGFGQNPTHRGTSIWHHGHRQCGRPMVVNRRGECSILSSPTTEAVTGPSTFPQSKPSSVADKTDN